MVLKISLGFRVDGVLILFTVKSLFDSMNILLTILGLPWLFSFFCLNITLVGDLSLPKDVPGGFLTLAELVLTCLNCCQSCLFWTNCVLKGFSCSRGGDGSLPLSLLPLLLLPLLPSWQDTDLPLLPFIRQRMAPLLPVKVEDTPGGSISLSDDTGEWLREEMPESDPECANLW